MQFAHMIKLFMFCAMNATEDSSLCNSMPMNLPIVSTRLKIHNNGDNGPKKHTDKG